LDPAVHPWNHIQINCNYINYKISAVNS
jgi:hypothetical protein